MDDLYSRTVEGAAAYEARRGWCEELRMQDDPYCDHLDDIDYYDEERERMSKPTTAQHPHLDGWIMAITRCSLCGGADSFALSEAKWDRWQNGELIQNVWPEMPPGRREQLISGTHEACFDEAFGEDNDE